MNKKIASDKRRVFSWMDDRLTAMESEKYGKAVYATAPIKKGTLLMVFGGYVMSRLEEEQLPLKIRDIAITIDKDLVIGVNSAQQLSHADYVNHSCNPNSGIKGQISLKAMLNIKKGDEITFDYGTVLFRVKGAPKYELPCLCGAKDCRKKITQYDWKLPELQERYRGFFPYYIQEEIDRLKK